MSPSLRRIIAFFRKEFINDISYSLSFLSRWVGILLTVFTFYYFSRLVGGRQSSVLDIYGGDYFSFIIVGLAVSSLVNSCLNGFPASVSREQAGGTLEFLLTTSTKPSVLWVAFSLYNLFMGFLSACFFVLIAFFLGLGSISVNGLSLFVFLLCGIFCFQGLGMISASIGLMFRRGDPVRWIIGNLFWLLGGLYFPVSVLPDILQNISRLIPTTYLLHAVRLSFLRGTSLVSLKMELAVMMCFCGLLFAIGYFVFSGALRYAKRKGTLSFS